MPLFRAGKGRREELRSYPEDRLSSPLDVRTATFTFEEGSQRVDGSLVGSTAVVTQGDRLSELLDRQGVTPFALAGMLAVAALVGAGHALTPGHGKTLTAAYLVGTSGRPLDAVLLGVIVSAMHTTSVLLLGIALHQVDQSFALEQIYPALTLISGAAVLLVGAWLARSRLRALRAGNAGDLASPRDELVLSHSSHEHAQHGEHRPPTTMVQAVTRTSCPQTSPHFLNEGSSSSPQQAASFHSPRPSSSS